MYSRMSHILTSSQNLEVLTEGVKGLCKSKKIECSDNDVKISLDAHIKLAIENNIAGTRYLISEGQLSSANLYIAMKSFNDLKSHHANPKLDDSLKVDVVENHSIYRKRREIRVADRFFEAGKEDDNERIAAHAIPRPTPRQLSRK